jgi:tensin
MDAVIHGDMLIRCRHIHPHRGVRDSMFRAALHTGYTPVGVMRLTKAQLDGCDTDDRFDDDFFVDFIFAPVEKRETSVSAPSKAASEGEAAAGGGMEVSDSGLILDSEVASKFDEMLHKDGRFWDKIAMRKNRAMDGRKKLGRKIVKSSTEIFSIDGEGTSNKSNDALSTPPVVLDVLSSTPPKRASELATMELIMQLAEAEGEELPRTNPSSSRAVATRAASSSSSHVSDIDMLLGESVKSGPASAAGASSVDDIITSAQNELDALEDFERELGLSGSGSTAASSATGAPDSRSSALAGAAASTDDSFEENLDELEKYLQSLGNS